MANKVNNSTTTIERMMQASFLYILLPFNSFYFFCNSPKLYLLTTYILGFTDYSKQGSVHAYDFCTGSRR